MMIAFITAKQDEWRSHERVKYAGRHLQAHFAGMTAEQIRRADVAAYILKRKKDGMAASTINRELNLLSAAFNYTRTQLEWHMQNPVERMLLKKPEGLLRWVTRIEADTLIDEAEKEPKSPHLADFIRLAVNTGCRKNEMLKLSWERVDLKANRIYLDSEDTKNGKRRIVPVNLEARQALLNRARFRAEYCPGSPWVFAHKDGKRVQFMQNGFQAACKRAGIENFRVHDLRHTCASWLVNAGVPLPEVRDLLGHSSIEMTERYAHLAPENLKGAVSVLDRLRSGYAAEEEIKGTGTNPLI
jgi:integrase